ncbi:hypothetical protein DICPUDRAFT_158024 [Dictyostelium purpureum]|uniref:Sphingomyelin phosphodiesterase n=1 Tax=Dictyostelium purpureum TaxID=5786 RepID=F1A0M2_DICPU|nr:uncharacterized protein DICPUDRAFT_158024 [Dictyostelium purpureum]EGC30266.1 hypothetical protein DICPUDRAFT_158024 [Dictyostelium purpureum]|eukprot:XP_003293218.1 hypothetical protein DICPUDRAFT_158024 [Dictyostelium purpureum]
MKIINIILLFLIINLAYCHNSINKQNNNKNDININQYNNIDINNIDDKVLLKRLGYDTNGTKCDVCTYGINEIQKMIITEKGPEDIKAWAIDLCTYLRIEKPQVCEGLIPLFMGMAKNVLSFPGVNGEFVCGYVGFCPYKPSNYTPEVIFPKPKPPHVPVVPPSPGSPTMKILHLSDIHVDPIYEQGMNADCGEPLCCRAVNGPGKGSNAAGKWGHYSCDVNLLMVGSMFEFIENEFGNEIDMVFWTGDNPPHDIWEQTFDGQLNSSLLVTNLVKKYFGSSKIFPAIGNHESLPVNSFPLPPGSSWLFNALASDWSDWINTDEQVKTLQWGGYYTLPVQNGIRVVSLNMNWCNNGNLWMVENGTTDAAGMLQWVIETLQASEDIGEKVYLVGHIPPGIADCVDIWSEQFFQIVNRYEDTIIASFYGHTHRDEFEIYYTQDENNPNQTRPSSVVYVTPSVTTYQHQNPSFRIYTVDAQTGYVMESSTYHTDLSQANLNDKPTWLLEYNATKAYNMPDLTPTSWHHAVSNMTADSSLFEKYYNYYYSSSPYPESKPCTSDSCKLDFICKMSSATYLKYYECVHQKITEHLSNEPNDQLKVSRKVNILLDLQNYLNNDTLKSC